MTPALAKTSKYLTTSVLNTLVGYTVIVALHIIGISPYWANLSGYIVGFCLSFMLNKSWVFKDERATDFGIMAKYGVSFACSYCLNLIVLYLFLELGMPAPGAQLFAMAVYSVSFFLFLNIVVFRNAMHKQHTRFWERIRSVNMVALLLFSSLSITLWLLAPQDGAFWWSEAPRNALNGVFILDLLRELPFSDPVGWAENYYKQYPALTILFYPPMQHAMLAGWFFLFGISQFAANALMALMYFALLQGVFMLVKQLSSPLWALITALTVGTIYQITFWASQIMLEVPMMAFLVWALYFAVLYLNNAKLPFLAGFVIMALASLYTKQTSLIIIAVAGVFILTKHWRHLLTSKRSIFVLLFAAISLLPLLWIQLTYGSFNVTSVVARDDVGLSRSELSTWLWYLLQLPEAVGWAVCAAFILGTIGLTRRAKETSQEKDDHFWMFLLITIATYCFFTLISLKEHRHGIPLYVSLALFLVPQIRFLLNKGWVPHTLACLGTILAFVQVGTQEVPAIQGYNKAADWLQENADENDRIVFAGNRDGHFIFNMRAKERGKNLRTIRADKLFLNINIMPELGLNAQFMSTPDIEKYLQRLGIRYVATIENFWVHEPVMQNFSNALNGAAFKEIKRIEVEGSPSRLEKMLVLYEATYSLPEHPEEPDLRLEAINRTIAK